MQPITLTPFEWLAVASMLSVIGWLVKQKLKAGDDKFAAHEKVMEKLSERIDDVFGNLSLTVSELTKAVLELKSHTSDHYVRKEEYDAYRIQAKSDLKDAEQRLNDKIDSRFEIHDRVCPYNKK